MMWINNDGIASVKSLLSEPSQNYEEDMHNLEKHHPFTPVQRLRVVIPLAWNRYHKEMLQKLKMFLDDDRVGLDGHVGMMQIFGKIMKLEVPRQSNFVCLPQPVILQIPISLMRGFKNIG
jgi:hypothetical protein